MLRAMCSAIGKTIAVAAALDIHIDITKVAPDAAIKEPSLPRARFVMLVRGGDASLQLPFGPAGITSVLLKSAGLHELGSAIHAAFHLRADDGFSQRGRRCRAPLGIIASDTFGPKTVEDEPELPVRGVALAIIGAAAAVLRRP